MKNRLLPASLALVIILGSALVSGCGKDGGDEKSIVVTHSILGSIVKELAGDEVPVIVLMPDGADPHDWEPSARDIESLNNAGLIVWNGLDLEVSIESAVGTAVSRGVKLFTATDHIVIRYVGEGEIVEHENGGEGEEHELKAGAPDPHFWVDPLAMKSVVTALAAEMKATLGLDVDSRARDLESRLDALHSDIALKMSQVAPGSRKLVTGHDSMGYFARRYGFQLIGAVIPSLSTQAEVSAADLAALIAQIRENQVKAIFT
jgi:zinc/manganese transport system substrate-binding protein